MLSQIAMSRDAVYQESCVFQSFMTVLIAKIRAFYMGVNSCFMVLSFVPIIAGESLRLLESWCVNLSVLCIPWDECRSIGSSRHESNIRC